MIPIPLPLQLAAWNFWSPSGTDVLAWLNREGEGRDAHETVAPVKSVAPLQRRRMSRLSRMALEVATEMPGSADANYYVFCSRHGEIQRTASILDDLARGIEPSPTDFALSVHNTSGGLFSIVQQLRSPSTSVCAGELTFTAGWIEAAAWLAVHPDDAVLLVMFDESLPPMLRDDISHVSREYALALMLARSDRGLLLEPNPGSEGASHTVGPRFLAWWLSGEREFPVCAEKQGWRWRRDD